MAFLGWLLWQPIRALLYLVIAIHLFAIYVIAPAMIILTIVGAVPLSVWLGRVD